MPQAPAELVTFPAAVHGLTASRAAARGLTAGLADRTGGDRTEGTGGDDEKSRLTKYLNDKLESYKIKLKKN